MQLAQVLFTTLIAYFLALTVAVFTSLKRVRSKYHEREWYEDLKKSEKYLDRLAPLCRIEAPGSLDQSKRVEVLLTEYRLTQEMLRHYVNLNCR